MLNIDHLFVDSKIELRSALFFDCRYGLWFRSVATRSVDDGHRWLVVPGIEQKANAHTDAIPPMTLIF
ncbi:MAG TPA: hypothetical protein VF503_13515 [Sphingobium sp.]|uniref:hypothetical protein n=1 Tax=Sphingobium sp. TaxID=1912891 RepID=UPI002ED4D139